MRIDLTGKQEQVSAAIWWAAGTGPGRLGGIDIPGWNGLIMNWGGKGTAVHWANAAAAARVDFNPNDHLGNLLYVRPEAPYLPFAGSDRLWLKRLAH